MGRFFSLAEKRKQLQGKKMKRKDDGYHLKKFPCKRFRVGDCEFTKDDCRYSHDMS